MSNFDNPNTITLCGCGCTTKNCPTLELQEDGNFLLFRDDFGQQIKITLDDLNSFVQLAKEGRFNHWLADSTLSTNIA